MACNFSKKSEITKLKLPRNFQHPNFISLAINKNGELLAGNLYGEVLHTNGQFYKKYFVPEHDHNKWLRKLLCVNKQVFAIHDGAMCLDFQKNFRFTNKINQHISIKTGLIWNDSILIIGSNNGLIKYKYKDQTYTFVKNSQERTQSLTKTNDSTLYFIGMKGLYKYNFFTDTARFIALKNPYEKARFNALQAADRGDLWLSTWQGDLVLLRQDTIAAVIPNKVGLPENVSCLLWYKNRMWVGSKSGICVISVQFRGNKFYYSPQNILEKDGLPSNYVNDLVGSGDTIFAATDKGVALISASYFRPNYAVRPVLISVKANEDNLPLANQYNLRYFQNSLLLSFAGLELSGHFKYLQYALDDSLEWHDMQGNSLSIWLSGGEHKIYVKAIDTDGNTSGIPLRIDFTIRQIFYQTIWFWVLLVFVVIGLTFYFINRRQLFRQKLTFQKNEELEQQRKKITADLHDEIGASLSSLQVNSNIANRLLDTRPEQAKVFLDKIESQAQQLGEAVSDIIWSMKPGEEELISLSERIKNFAHTILDATTIKYVIKVDEQADKKITDLTIRKGVLLITKEAINNAVKYSNATELYVGLQLENATTTLVIRDNGIGFNQNLVKGNGIHNFKRRAIEMKAQLAIDSEPGKGTTIKVVIGL